MSERNLDRSTGNVSEELKIALEYLFGIAQSKNLSLTSHLIDAAKKSLDLSGNSRPLSILERQGDQSNYKEGRNDD